MTWRVSEGPSIEPPWCRETLVSRTATRPITVAFKAGLLGNTIDFRQLIWRISCFIIIEPDVLYKIYTQYYGVKWVVKKRLWLLKLFLNQREYIQCCVCRCVFEENVQIISILVLVIFWTLSQYLLLFMS